MNINRTTPTIEELQERILNHVSRRGATVPVINLWRGYLAGLLEWGLIDQPEFDSLVSVFAGGDETELHRLFADEAMP